LEERERLKREGLRGWLEGERRRIEDTRRMAEEFKTEVLSTTKIGDKEVPTLIKTPHGLLAVDYVDERFIRPPPDERLVRDCVEVEWVTLPDGTRLPSPRFVPCPGK